MSRRRRPRVRADEVQHPRLSGIALLLVETAADTLDLHGCNARQAETRLVGFLRSRATTYPGRVVHVITGRGNRSERGPVLLPLVGEILADEGAEYVSEHASIRGGGGFAVRLRAEGT